ncbi:MAG: hypothetical protein M0P11_10410, partial [Anaerolineaceae bacterium]|nr:hypothetical protein [Anaerolineaceae bacterium]
NNVTLVHGGVFLGWLICLATNNQPDTPLFFNSSNTRFSYSSLRAMGVGKSTLEYWVRRLRAERSGRAHNKLRGQNTLYRPCISLATRRRTGLAIIR